MARRSACSAAGKIQGLRKIVEHHQHAKVCGTRVDAFTASAILAVYDKLNDANRAKMASFPVPKMAAIALKMLK